jgi:hypothetical protein
MTNSTSASLFVWVADDGTAHELNEEQKAYVNTEFHGSDGARPYIKASYESLTPDGRIGGYLYRAQLPDWVRIKVSSN